MDDINIKLLETILANHGYTKIDPMWLNQLYKLIRTKAGTEPSFTWMQCSKYQELYNLKELQKQIAKRIEEIK